MRFDTRIKVKCSNLHKQHQDSDKPELALSSMTLSATKRQQLQNKTQLGFTQNV